MSNKIYIWASDYSNYTGEGNLGRLFVNIKLKENFRCIICTLKVRKNYLNKILNYKYLLPLLGILNCWKFHFKGQSVCYLNYLPLWNSIIFLLLPPNTILGPITGGSHYKKEISLNYIIRNFCFPFFYKLSSHIIHFRNFKTIFSTDLLKKYLPKKIIKKSEFNFVLNRITKKKFKKRKKNINFIIYYRKHKNKVNLYPIDFIKKLSKYGFKVYIVGDFLNIKNVKNLGYIKNEKLNKILSKSKFSINSGENIFSLFTIDCLNYDVKIFSSIKPKLKKFF